MSKHTVETERARYEKAWSIDGYRTNSPAERHIGEFLKLLPESKTIIDFGCGTGRASLRMQKAGHEVLAIDHAANAMDPEPAKSVDFLRANLWELPDGLMADVGFCVDVMEHIPEEHVEAVLVSIYTMCEEAAYFRIATVGHNWRPVGEMHLTIKGGEWWFERLRALWGSVEEYHDHKGGAKGIGAWCKK